MYRAARAAAERGGVRSRKAMTAASLLIALLTSGCFTSIEGGPPRLFSIAEESAVARARLTLGEEAYYASPVAQNKRVRNEIVFARMRAIDSYYYAFEASLIRERQEVGFISSIISIGLSGAVPLVSAVDTKNILGAASSGLQGATKAYSDEVLFQKTVQVLTTQMRARRDIIASDLVSRLRTLDIEAYPLSMALSDVDEYYAAGTIAGALIEIQKTVSAESRNAEAIKAGAVLVRFAPVTDLGRRIQAFFNASAANRAAVTAWIRENAQGLPFAVFIRSENAPLHRAIIQALGIP
jgi:hypothetical protein